VEKFPINSIAANLIIEKTNVYVMLIDLSSFHCVPKRNKRGKCSSGISLDRGN
jgi:hypothetical protein